MSQTEDDVAKLKRIAEALLLLVENFHKPPIVEPPVEPPVVPPVEPPVTPPGKATIRITPHAEGKIEGAPPRDFEYTVAATNTRQVKAAVFQVKDGQWSTKQGSFDTLTIPNDGNGSVKYTGKLHGSGDRLVVKTLSEDVEDVTEGASFAEEVKPPVSSGDGAINILIRGQSNALLFCDWGGAWAMHGELTKRTGRACNLIYGWSGATQTIWSGTPFLGNNNEKGWKATGKQETLRRVHESLPADKKAAPFVTLWAHNESDQKIWSDFSTSDWVQAVREDMGMMRAALGRSAADAPVIFLPIRYNYGDISRIRAGMDQLVADRSFNAWLSMAAWGATMDGDGQPNSSHMGRADSVNIGRALGQELAARYSRA